MRRPSPSWFALLPLLAACAVEPLDAPPASRDAAPHDTPTPDVEAVDVYVDAAPPDVAPPDVAPPDMAPPDATPTTAPPCSARTLPTLEAGRGYEQGPALVLVSGGDRVRGACTAWHPGDDATARFVAPRAGRWVFSAVGDALWSLSARTPCADDLGELACARFVDPHGPEAFSRPLVVARELREGEALDLVADGCPTTSRTACRWALRAQLEAPPARDCAALERPCLAGQRCASWGDTCVVDTRDEPVSAPELVTAVAVRVLGTLRFLTTSRDPGVNGGAGPVAVRLLDAQGDVIASERFRDLDDRAVFTADGALVLGGSYRRHAPGVYGGELVVREPEGVAARTAEFVFAGARHRVAVEDLDPLPDGARCGVRGIFDVCLAGSACSPAGRCARLSPPTILSASAWRTGDPARTALVVRWEDPNRDVDAVEYRALARAAAPVTLPPTSEGASSTTWSHEAFVGATSVAVRVRDRAGLWSDALTVPVRSPELVGEGWVCDGAGMFSQCPEGTLCTRYGEPRRCEERRCFRHVRACPEGVSVQALTPGRDGSVTVDDSGDAAPPVRGIPCDEGYSRSTKTRFYAYRAAAAGRYEVSAALRGGPWFNLRFALRRYCALGDHGVERPGGFDSTTQAQTLTTTLAEGEEVYVLVGSTPVIDGTPVGGYRLGVRRVGP